MLSIGGVTHFFTHTLWQLERKDVPTWKWHLIEFTRILVAAYKEFTQDNNMLRASALTFFSMLSIVPVFAMLFGIAKGFGFEQKLEEELKMNASYNQEVIEKVLEFSHSMLDNTKGGLVAGLGILILFWSVMKVLSNIEASFNEIWRVKKSRTWIRKFTDYLSIMLLAPVLIILSSSVTVFVGTQVKNITENVEYVRLFGPFILNIIKIIPYVILWTLFTMIYMVMPNKKINVKSAIVAGIVAGTLFQVVEMIYVNFQVGVGRYNAVYGGFAALPLFLVWLQTSWIVVLFGAEISYAHQNLRGLTYEKRIPDLNIRQKLVAIIKIFHLIVNQFKDGKEAPDQDDIAEYSGLPKFYCLELLDALQQAELISEIAGGESISYQPAMDIHQINYATLLNKLASMGGKESAENDELVSAITEDIKSFEKSISDSAINRRIMDI